MKTPIVKILVTIPDERSFDACTLVFKTLRVGFPNAKIHVDINHTGQPDLCKRATDLANAAECFVRWIPRIHLSDWIRNAIEGHIYDSPLILLDADTIFWKSVEDWEDAPEGVLLAGYHVPTMWNDFAKCVSMPRIHTSFMLFPNVAALRQEIRKAYPYAYEKAGEFCPCDPFMTSVKFINGKPIFWDACANLYGMLSQDQIRTLSQEKKECFDHLNSASFYDVMCERMDDASGFKMAHDVLVKTPEKLRNLWPIVDGYYHQKWLEGKVVLGSGL